MKKLAMIMAVAGLVLAAGSQAQAAYVSTFNVSQESFSLTGFSWDDDGNPDTPRVATPGPDYLHIDSVVGTYSLDIPPAGSGLWDVNISGWVEAQYGSVYDPNWDPNNVDRAEFDEDVGQYNSPGPSTSWGPGSIDFAVTYGILTFNFTLAYQVDLDGSYPSGNFGNDAYADFTLSGDPTGMLLGNTYLTDLDNDSGGGDGVIDGWMRGEITVTCVPEPATMCLLSLGALGLIRRRRRK